MNNQRSLPIAGPMRRVLALCYDALVVSAITLVTVLILSIVAVIVTGTGQSEIVVLYNQLWYQLALITVNIIFFIYFWRRDGQTLGMRAWRLKLLNSKGGHLNTKQCLARCLLAPFSIGLILAGYWWCWFDKEGYTAHDRLLKQRVVVLPKLEKNKK